MDHQHQQQPPPPPPPHGANGPKGSGLPPGNYDIFIVPPHSSGSGFLYLPSLQPHRNSFIAGSACTLLAVVTFQIMVPAIKSFVAQLTANGGSGVIVLIFGAVVVGWAYGQSQKDTGPNPGGGPPKGGGTTNTPRPESAHYSYAGANGNASAGAGTYANTGAGATPGAAPGGMPGSTPGAQKPSGWQKPASTGPSSAQSAWERARQETRERKAKEEAEKEKGRVREKEAKERRERELKEKELKEKIERDRASEAPKTAYASTTGERTNPYSRPTHAPRPASPAPTTPASSPKKTTIPRSPSPTKRNSPPKKAYATTEDDAYSYRPYDKPKTPQHQKSHGSVYSASSYAASQSTSRTSPPPSMRGPYTTSDPDKIVIKGVYAFNSAFVARPNAQLISGIGSVTDGLVLKITTEGLFIDDDVRAVPQREWDVKAWTMKLVEVWCPLYCSSGASFGSSTSEAPGAAKRGNVGARLFGQSKHGRPSTSEELDLIFEDLLRVCKKKCCAWSEKPELKPAAIQNGDFNGLHVLRASIRDQDGKRYVFVLEEGEGWKVAIGLQRLRRGTQVRALAVSGIPKEETKTLLGGLGYLK